MTMATAVAIGWLVLAVAVGALAALVLRHNR
jgi:hypothetical protein